MNCRHRFKGYTRKKVWTYRANKAATMILIAYTGEIKKRPDVCERFFYFYL